MWHRTFLLLTFIHLLSLVAGSVLIPYSHETKYFEFDIEGVMYLGKTKVSWNEDLTKPWNSKRLLLSATLCNAAWDALQRDPLLRYVGKGTCILEYVHQGDFGILHMRLPLYEVQSYGVDQTEEGFGDKVKKLFEKYKPTGEQYYFGKGIRINVLTK
ncbi:hypothetical protein CSKR_113793 [Clonorchis sinensis]|uniref:Uncharacterized protein n=1 Tax=Clonorchis sinensis TaxID=79923 RepID=A0A8T1MV85_CLOSI|nr:hypothetical protein CSKR_113793 [Clonorchis sinensis]